MNKLNHTFKTAYRKFYIQTPNLQGLKGSTHAPARTREFLEFARLNLLRKSPRVCKPESSGTQVFLLPLPSSRCALFSAFFGKSLRPISNSQLHTLLHFHLCPIYLMFSKGS